MNGIPKYLDNLTEVFSKIQLLSLQAEEKEGRIDYQKLFDEMKELSDYSLTHADILYSAKGLKLITLARFFGVHPDYTKNRWRLKKVKK